MGFLLLVGVCAQEDPGTPPWSSKCQGGRGVGE